MYKTTQPMQHHELRVTILWRMSLPALLAASVLSLWLAPETVAAQEDMTRAEWERAMSAANGKVRRGQVSTVIGSLTLGFFFYAEENLRPEYVYFGDPIPGQEARREAFEDRQLYLAISGTAALLAGVGWWLNGSRGKRDLEALDRQGLVAALPLPFLLGSSRPALGAFWQFSVP